jgi:hypothetical protein
LRVKITGAFPWDDTAAFVAGIPPYLERPVRKDFWSWRSTTGAPGYRTTGAPNVRSYSK